MNEKKLFLTNILVLMQGTKRMNEEAKRLLRLLTTEKRISAEELGSIYKAWQASPREFVLTNDAAKGLASLALLVVFYNTAPDEEKMSLLKSLATQLGLAARRVNRLLEAPLDPSSITNLTAFTNSLISDTSPRKTALIPGRSEELSYVATQITKEGIDELQALLLCYQLNLNAALDGPPGVGKTQSVIELARILDIPLFTKTCSSRTTESHIISHPVLIEQNGVTITSHQNGALARAMEEGAIFYGDEYNLLKEDVQKRMNSAFDDRKTIDRNDGVTISATPGFFAIISYNPTRQISTRDLEDSVADRFVHFHFSPHSSDLRAYISLLKSHPASPPDTSHCNITLEKRGLATDGTFLILDKSSNVWRNFLTGEPSSIKPAVTYMAFHIAHLNRHDKESGNGLAHLASKSYKEIDLARIFSRFTELMNDLAEKGTSPLVAKLGLSDLVSNDQFELLKIHSTSTRIIRAAILHYNHLISLGWNSYLAQSYATSLIINQMCYGSYRTAAINNITNIDLANKLAGTFALYANDKEYNTNLTRSMVL